MNTSLELSVAVTDATCSLAFFGLVLWPPGLDLEAGVESRSHQNLVDRALCEKLSRWSSNRSRDLRFSPRRDTRRSQSLWRIELNRLKPYPGHPLLRESPMWWKLASAIKLRNLARQYCRSVFQLYHPFNEPQQTFAPRGKQVEYQLQTRKDCPMVWDANVNFQIASEMFGNYKCRLCEIELYRVTPRYLG
ncbi:unnamed protein product [Clavelina lepadiformis]|uniref:Uncharacterized protein n=1 Tax=Clavelina lepadiformis TaxID=159417 RepID=A0ABP0EZZ5_CLALP